MSRAKKKQQRTPRKTKPQQELPVEARQPDTAAKRLAIITVFGLIIVLGAAGALLEIFVAPLFSTSHGDKDVQLSYAHHVHAPVTSELDFLIQMVPHHQEAIDTARIVAASTTNDELKTLAEAIIRDQSAEILQMNAWIDAWYPNQRYQHSYEPMMPDLERLRGTARDEAFLRGMIDHHTMAVHMARQVKELEPRAEVLALADLIILTQTAEMVQMERLLG